MSRQGALFRYAMGSVRRRPRRSVALVVGLAFVTGLFSAVVFLTDALQREFAVAAAGAPALTVQRTIAGRPALIDEEIARGIHEMRAVQDVSARVWGYLFVPAIGANLTVIGSDTPPTDAAGATLIDGAWPAAVTAADNGDEGEPPQAVVGTGLADILGLSRGDRLALPSTSGTGYRLLEVSGRFTSDSAIRTADVLYVREKTARDLLGVPAGQATDLAITLTNPDEAGVIAGRIVEDIPGSRVLDRRLVGRTYALTFDTRAGVMAGALLPLLAALLLLLWDRLTGVTRDERREIGVLKAIGWETRDVMTARTYEQLFTAFTGSALGVALAYVFVFVLGAPGLRGVLFGWSALYPPLDLTPAVDTAQILSIVGVVIVPFVAAGLVPTFRASSLDPNEAIRGTA